MKVYDFVCRRCGHRHEAFVEADVRTTECPNCPSLADRAIPAPRFTLEGITGAFPGAHMQWEKKRAEKMAVQERKQRDHGDDGWT